MTKPKKEDISMSIEELERRKEFFTKKIQEYGAAMDATSNESILNEIKMASEVELLNDMITEFTSDNGKISPKDDKELNESIIKRDKLKQSVNISESQRQIVIAKTQKKIEICKQKLDDIEGDIMYITRNEEEDAKTDEEKLEEIKDIVKSNPELLEDVEEL